MPPAAPVTIATLRISIVGSSLIARAYRVSDLKGGVSAAVISQQTSLRENGDNALGEGFLVFATFGPALGCLGVLDTS